MWADCLGRRHHRRRRKAGRRYWAWRLARRSPSRSGLSSCHDVLASAVCPLVAYEVKDPFCVGTIGWRGVARAHSPCSQRASAHLQFPLPASSSLTLTAQHDEPGHSAGVRRTNACAPYFILNVKSEMPCLSALLTGRKSHARRAFSHGTVMPGVDAVLISPNKIIHSATNFRDVSQFRKRAIGTDTKICLTINSGTGNTIQGPGERRCLNQ